MWTPHRVCAFTPKKYRSFVLDGDRSTFEKITSPNKSVVIDLGKKRQFNTVLVREAISQGQAVQSFSIEVPDGKGWREIARSSTIGARKILQFPEVKARQIRIRILASKREAALSEVEVYQVEEVR